MITKTRRNTQDKIMPRLYSLLLLFFFILNNTRTTSSTISISSSSHRRILHQPLYPAVPPPSLDSPPPPPPDNTDEPFFPEVPNSYQTPPPQTIASSNGSISIPTATQPNKPTKRVAIAISVGIVTLGMLSALAFFLYRHRARHSSETTQKLVNGNHGNNSLRALEVPQSNFLYIGTVEPPPSNHRRSAVLEAADRESTAANNVSPYRKLNSAKRSDRYRPSPELQPLPPLSSLGEQQQNRTSSSAVISSSDEESHEDTYYTPKASSSSVASNEDVTPPTSRPLNHNHTNKPHSKRTSPKTRLSNSSPDMKFAVIPSIKQPQPPPPPPPPHANGYVPQRPKLSAAPPPPNMALLQSISNNQSNIPVPPPPPLPPLFAPRSVGNLEETSFSSNLSHILSKKQTPHIPSPKDTSRIQTPKPVNGDVSEPSSLERLDSDEMEGGRPKLKALHWDKVRAISERATVWDQLKSSSFQLNEDMMESLFGCNSANSVPKEAAKKSALPPVEHEHRVLDPKKSQNIAILLRALNVTKDEVSEALLDGTLEGLGAELLETLVKMAPTREEEIKLQDYRGDISKLGSAERFLKSILDIPFAFKRVEVMLYRENFDTEIKYLRTSFQTLEAASEELKNSRLFLKLLEAVLRAGNRMNVGTNRGDAKAFKLDTLLKLVDIKGTDGKTTLLHFVVQEITRSEDGITTDDNHQIQIKNDDFKKQGLKVVSGLSRDLINVKKAAGMDSYVLNSYVSKLEIGLEKVRLVLQYENPNIKGRFFESIKAFLRDADKEIVQIKSDEKKALSLVKEATEYFHGDTAKEEAHPFRIFMIVRDFLNVLDHVCKEVGRMQDRTLVGSARSFRISSTAPLPVLNRYNFRQHKSSDEESMTP